MHVPAIQILDPSFAKYRLALTSVERLGTGVHWAEGPVWFGDRRMLLFSDVPSNRIMKWDEDTGQLSVFRKPSNYANGNTRDRLGRLPTCEHQPRRVTRTEYDGSITTSSHFGFLGLGWGRLKRWSAGRARWRPSEGQGFQELGPRGEHNIGAQGLQVVEEAGSGSKRLAGVPPSA